MGYFKISNFADVLKIPVLYYSIILYWVPEFKTIGFLWAPTMTSGCLVLDRWENEGRELRKMP